jgi:hypothetical protein
LNLMSARRPGRGLVQGISVACADRGRILEPAKDAPRNARYPSTGGYGYPNSSAASEPWPILGRPRDDRDFARSLSGLESRRP